LTIDVASSTARTARIELPGGRRAGVHLPMGVGLVRVAERASEIGASAVQIFSDNPTAWKRRAETPPDAPAFRQRLAELDIGPVAIHASYLVNLAGPDDELFGKSVELMRHELAGAAAFGASFVNVHVGSHRGSGVEEGIARIGDGLERASDGAAANGGLGAPLIVLENSSGGGFAVGARLEELAMVLDAAAARGMDGRIAFCLDAAHLWGAGYDVSAPDGVDDVIAAFDRLIGVRRLVMVHLNDSESGLGSRHDRHAHLGDGRIGRDGLAHLLCHPSLDHVAFYLETPRMEDGFDAINVARMGDLAAGRPLTPGEGVPWTAKSAKGRRDTAAQNGPGDSGEEPARGATT
jgi:deoxyribonuclease-4